MLKNACVLIILIQVAVSAYSQDLTNTRRVELNAGIGFIARQDRIFSPMIHKDMSVANAGIAFIAEGRLYHNISLRFSSFNPVTAEPFDYYEDGELKSAAPHSFILVNLSYNGGKTWQTGKGELSAGLLLSADVQALNYVYGRISSFGYFSAIGPGVFAKYSRQTGEKGRISASLNLPVISLYSRSPYLVNDDEFIENISSHSGLKTFIAFLADGEWVTWNRLQHFNAGIKYEHDLSDKWGIGTSWMFDFIHASAPRKLLSFRNTINLSANFRF